MPDATDKSHTPAGHNVYRMTDETPPPISMCVIAATAAYGTGIESLTWRFKGLDIREKRT
jgi:hypothetical protein